MKHMDQDDLLVNDHLLQKPHVQISLDSEDKEWQPFFSESKHQNQNVFNSRTLKLPPYTPKNTYLEQEDFSSKGIGTSTLVLPSTAYSRTENTDFLSAIPYAR